MKNNYGTNITCFTCCCFNVKKLQPQHYTNLYLSKSPEKDFWVQEYLRLKNGAYADSAKLLSTQLNSFNGHSKEEIATCHFRRGCMGMLELENIEFVEPESAD